MANATGVASSLTMGAAGLKTVGALILILAMIFVGFYILRRYGHKAGLSVGKSGPLTHVANLSVGPKKSVVVVRFLNEYLVLGVSETQIEFLTKIKANETDHENNKEFAHILSRKTSQAPDDS